jgi:hypothetical protein
MTASVSLCARRIATCLPFSAAAGLALAGLAARGVSAAVLYSEGDTQLRWDNTVKYTAAVRLSGQHQDLIGNRNSDDGDRSFDPGLISNRFDLYSQLDFSKSWFGFDASAALWYDAVYNQRNDNDSPSTFNPLSVANNEFTHDVRDLHGKRAELVNAFAYANVQIAGMPLSVRLGRHTLLWGESVFFPQNGIAAGQAPVDEIKVLGRPTSYSKEVFMPVTQASASLQVAGNMTLEAYYQFEWRNTRLPGVGSYFSIIDDLDEGGERYFLRSGFLRRTLDQKPPSTGQYGAAIRLSYDDVDYGLYALRFNAKDPEVYYRPGIVLGSGNPPTVLDPSIVDLSTGQVGLYNLVYPQGIEIYGLSASGYVGGWNVAGEISARRNTPLPTRPPFVPPGVLADGDKHPFYAVGDTLNAQLSTVTTFSRSSLWDSAALNFEIAGSDRLSISRNPSALDPSSDRVSLAARATFEPTYFAVLPSLDLTPIIGAGYNFLGYATAGYSEGEGAGDFEVGLTATYRFVWSASVLYSHFIGSDRRQPLADRDFISFTIQRTF